MEELKKKTPGAGVKKEAAAHLPAGRAGGGRWEAAALPAAWLLAASVLFSVLSLHEPHFHSLWKQELKAAQEIDASSSFPF